MSKYTGHIEDRRQLHKLLEKIQASVSRGGHNTEILKSIHPELFYYVMTHTCSLCQIGFSVTLIDNDIGQIDSLRIYWS